MTKRWTATPGRLDVGRLGRRRRARPHQPAHPREGAPGRARGRGRHQLLPEPAARLPRRHRVEPAAVPAGPRADRGHATATPPPSTTSTRARWRSGATRSTSTCGPTTSVTLSLQYSTQWDSLAHVGRRVRRRRRRRRGARLSTTATAPASTSSGRSPTPRATAAGTVCFAHHLGLEHMAFHGVQGRGVLVDLAHHLGHDWRGVDRADARGDHGGRQRRRGAGRHAADPHRLRDQGPRVEPRTRIPWRSTAMCTLPRRARRVAARVDRRVADLRARRRQLRGRGDGRPGRATRAGTRCCRSTTSACSSSAFRSGEMWYLHELATWLREHDRSRFLLTAPPLRLPGVVGSPLTPDRDSLNAL